MSVTREPSVGAAVAAAAAVVQQMFQVERPSQALHSATGSDRVDMRQVLGNRNDEQPDRIDQHVQYYLRHHPDISRKHKVIKKRLGVYEINRHEVWVEWQHNYVNPSQGYLLVIDGPLKQPFADYMTMTEANAEYDLGTVAKTTPLHHVPKEKRMTFDDTHKQYGRLEAMKVAKEQAALRDKAASYANLGKIVPDELVDKYNRNLDRKLGKNGRHRRHEADGRPPSPPHLKPKPQPLPQQFSYVIGFKHLKQNSYLSPQADQENSDPTPNAMIRQNSIQKIKSPQPVQQLQLPQQQSPQLQAPQKEDRKMPKVGLPPPPPWAVLAPRGISLNGLPLGAHAPVPPSGGAVSVPLPPAGAQIRSGSCTPSMPPGGPLSYVPPAASYVPPASSNSYVPPASASSYVPAGPASSYVPPASASSYVPAGPASSYVPSPQVGTPRTYPRHPSAVRTWSGSDMPIATMTAMQPGNAQAVAVPTPRGQTLAPVAMVAAPRLQSGTW